MPRHWTLKEAEAALFHVQNLLEEARRHHAGLQDAKAHMDDLRIVWGDQVHEPAYEAHLEWRNHLGRFQEAKTELEDILSRFEALGVEVKDIQSGLVDFRTLMGDQEAYLCWKDGEEGIQYWHTLEGGFAARQPIPKTDVEQP